VAHVALPRLEPGDRRRGATHSPASTTTVQLASWAAASKPPSGTVSPSVRNVGFHVIAEIWLETVPLSSPVGFAVS
jgi:hypothetical protein